MCENLLKPIGVTGKALLSAALFLGVFGSYGHETAHRPSARDSQVAPNFAKGVIDIPPLPPGVTALAFTNFFKIPIGPRGLEMTETLRALHGKKVRIIGYMVRQEIFSRGQFLLAPHPVQLHEQEYGLADDLPASTLRVVLPPEDQTGIAYTRGLLLLTGRLDVGSRLESDGRFSLVRLHLDQRPESSRP